MSKSTFIYTSGRRSPHHKHTGYGLKDGLEGASHELIRYFEQPCLELCETMIERKGDLVALHHGKELWRGAIELTVGKEPSGRPNVCLSGEAPSIELLEIGIKYGISWNFESDDGRVENLVQTEPSKRPSARLVQIVFLLIFITIASFVAWQVWEAYQRPSSGKAKPMRGYD